MPNRILTVAVAAWMFFNAGRGANPSAAEEREAAAGTITVVSDPADAAVYVDGQFAGRTPLTIERLRAGDHRVRVVKDGYLENGRIVAVGTGKSASLHLRLTPAHASSNGLAGQTGGGISSGPPGSSRKWWYLGAAGGGAAATALVLATRNHAPTIGTVAASPSIGLLAATPIAFTASGATDPDGDSLSYAWDFGDSSTSNEQAPRHVYSAAGTFSVRCTISDGNETVAGTTSVTIRSLAGTWRGVLQRVEETLGITHSGATVAGTFVDAVYGSGVISGFVATSPPLVRITIIQPGFNPFTYTANPNADITMLTGMVNGSGYINEPFSITRQ
jgi:PKD domain/PEGA domain